MVAGAAMRCFGVLEMVSGILLCGFTEASPGQMALIVLVYFVFYCGLYLYQIGWGSSGLRVATELLERPLRLIKKLFL